jgi:hypothetical protein
VRVAQPKEVLVWGDLPSDRANQIYNNIVQQASVITQANPVDFKALLSTVESIYGKSECMCESMTPVNWARFVPNESDEVKKDVSTEEPVSYNSDANISEDVILCGIMEISAKMLPDEPHKYYRSH